MPNDFLPERKATNTVFLSIYEGRLCQRRAAETPGFTKYESISPKTRGKISWIREFDHINGYITGFERVGKETLEGKRYMVARVTFNSGAGHMAVLEVPIKSEFVARFAKCVENMDLSRPVWMRAFLDRQGNTSIYFKQEGAKVEQRYTLAEPGGLPEWRKDPTTGEYDTREYWSFLFRVIADKALPQIAKNKAALDARQFEDRTVEEGDAADEAPLEKEEDDDIPF